MRFNYIKYRNSIKKTVDLHVEWHEAEVEPRRGPHIPPWTINYASLHPII